MVFSSEDKILIKNLVLLKGYSSRRLIKEFPQNGWNKNGLFSDTDNCSLHLGI